MCIRDSVWVYWNKLVERNPGYHIIGFIPIHLVNIEQAEVTVAVLCRTGLALNIVACAKAKPFYLSYGNVDIIAPGKVISASEERCV